MLIITQNGHWPGAMGEIQNDWTRLIIYSIHDIFSIYPLSLLLNESVVKTCG
jgi:hypothetical protein